MSPTPPQSSNRLPVIITLLIAVLGVPVAVSTLLYEEVTKNPGLWLVLVLVYEVIVLIFGFFAKVWQKLESKWVDRVADWIDTHLLSLFSGYKKRYLQHLIYQHRSFDVKGLSTQGTFTLELEQVFVELSLVSRPAHQTSADPFQQVPEELREGQHSIWDYLKAEKMANQHLAVIGAPGSGKTTLLKHITLTLASGKHTHQGSDIPRKLPILLFLRNLAEEIKTNANLSLAQAVRDNLAHSNGPASPTGWFEERLNQGRCLIMLDGLDEIADPQVRRATADWAEQQMVAYGKNRFIVTSRPFGYLSNPLTGVTVFEVRPFTREQVEHFVQNWYLANEVMSAQMDDPGVRLTAQEGAEDLLRRISGNAALSNLAVNPLLLTMIANVHRYRSSLPGRRVELYAEICEVFLGKRQQARGLGLDMTPAQKQRVLQPLAYGMMCHQWREVPLAEAVAMIQEPLARVSPQIPAEDFLKAIEQSSGLLLERESAMYSFAHLTFQEYLATVHIREQRLEEELQQQVSNSWWHETIRLYAAQADATPILVACLIDDKPSIPALTLAIECRAEAREIRPDVRERLDWLLNHEVEDVDPERRRIVAEALLAQRLHNLIRLDDDHYVDNTLITHAEYQLFIDERCPQKEYHQPDHWPAYQFPAGQGQMPIIGVRPSDAEAFCAWMSQREANNWIYRLPQSMELNDEIQTEAIGYWVKSGFFLPEYTLLGGPAPASLQSQFEKILDRDLYRDLASTRSHDSTGLRARALVRYSDLDRDLDSFHVRVRRLASARDLTSALARSSDLDRNLSSDLDPASDLDRVRALDKALNLVAARAVDRASDRASDRKQALEVEPFIDSCLDLYFTLIIVKARTRGEFPTYEGIRIVKERRDV